MKRYVIRITGKVQGVFFRDTARHAAIELGLNGFARNEPDGSVYIEVEGEAITLDKFLLWCHSGPQLAQIAAVQVSEHPPTGFIDFTIK